MKPLRPSEGPTFWTEHYARALELRPEPRRSRMRKVLAENVGETRGR